MKCRHFNIVCRVELQVSDYFVFLYSSSIHNLGNVSRVSPSCPITPNTLLKHPGSSYIYIMYVVPRFFIYPACYYKYLTKVHDGQPSYLSEWDRIRYLPPSKIWRMELKNLENFLSIPAPSNTHDYLGYLGDVPHSVFVNCPNSPNTVKLV